MATMRERWTRTSIATKSFIGACAGIVAVSSALTVIGIETPRPAWASELQTTEKMLKDHIVLVEMQNLELNSIITSQQLEDTTFSLYQNLREQNIYEREGEDVPDFLLEEQSDLEIRKLELENRLDQIFEKSNAMSN